MAMQELTIKRRDGSGKGFAKRLRREGAVPGVLYDGKKAESVTVDPKAVLRMIHGHEGTTELRAHEGVRIVNDPGQAGATVAPPMAEEVVATAAPAAAAVTEPEVLTERKPKEGEEAAAADDGKKPARPARAEKSEKSDK